MLKMNFLIFQSYRFLFYPQSAENLKTPKHSGVTTVVAATAVLWGPAGLGGPARPG